MIWSLAGLMRHCNTTRAEIDGKWVPAKPLDYRTLKTKFKEAKAVFKGEADAFTWPCGQ